MCTVHNVNQRNVNQRNVARRHGMPNVLVGLSELDLLTIHQTYRLYNAPTTAVEDYDVTDDDASRDQISDVIVNDAALSTPDSPRLYTRRNAICYDTDTEQIIRIFCNAYVNDLQLRNGHSWLDMCILY